MVATSVVVTTSTSTSPSVAMTETSPTTVPSTVASPSATSNSAMQPAVAGLPNVSPTAYQLLLKQVESLQMENSSLKAELKNNTSHISMLENEASRMKDMVLMLGKPAIPGVGVEGNSSSNNNVPHPGPCMGPSPTLDDNSPSNAVNGAPSHNFQTAPFLSQKFQSNVENDARRFRSQHQMDMQAAVPAGVKVDAPPPYNTANGSISPPPTTAVADAIRRQLALLNADRSRILVMVQKEEHQKDVYMKQLKELTQRLDSMSGSDKFTKANDKTRQQLEVDISTLQQRMEKTLGSPDVMEGQLQTWLRQIQILEREIQSLEQHLHKLEMTPTSPDLPQFPSVHTNTEVIADQGSCTKHASLLRGVMRCSEVSTQTPRINGSLSGMTYEEEFSSCDNSLLDVQVVTAGGIVSRPTQTIASCLAGRTVVGRPFSGTPVEMQGLLTGQQDPLSSRSDHKTQGSIESLPSQSDIDETASMHSFTTSLPRHFQSSAPGLKKDGGHSPSLVSSDKEELSRRFCTMSKTQEGCCAMRQTGCIPIIIQILHDGSLLNLPAGWTQPPGPGQLCHTVTAALKAAKEIRIGMCQAFRSIVMHTAPDGKQSAEGPILAQLECIRGYCERLFELWIYVQTLGGNKQDSKEPSPGLNGGAIENGIAASAVPTDGTSGSSNPGNSDRFDFRNGLVALYKPPMQSISAIMKLSHNEAVRGVINDLGGLFAVAELFVLHCRCASSTEKVYAGIGGDLPRPDERVLAQLQLLRRYVGFSLINLTYGDMQNKATLIQMPGLLDMVMMQLGTESEELQQAMARFLRNLSWQPDEKSRDILREKDVVSVLMNCALKSKREVTLNSVLSALWNLSGHCVENRTSICSVKGALGFLVWTLTYRSPTKSPAITESGGGILRNVSSVVATNEEYRQILRENNCLQILLTHLKAASLTIVSNACGTLWNLSARNAQDQRLLWDLGAVPMLRNLVHSKHSVIAQGSSAALRNLLSNRPDKLSSSGGDRSENAKLKARKQKSLDSFGPKSANEPSASDNFSPRHHTWTGYEKTTSPRPVLASTNQRRSLQETSSSSPTSDHDKSKRFNKGGAHYSGSLGSLPSSDFGEAFSKSYAGTSTKYVTGARNSSSFPDHYSSGGASGRGLRGSMTIDFGQSATQRGGGAMYPGGFSPISSGGMLKDVLMSSDATTTQNATQANKGGNKSTPKRPSQIGLMQYSQFVASGKVPLSSSFGSTPHHYQSQGQGSPIDPNRGRMYPGSGVDVAAMRQAPLQRGQLTPGRHDAPQAPYLMNASSPSWPATTKPENSHKTDRTQVPHVRGQAFTMSSSQRLQNLIKNSHVPGLNLAAPNPIMLNLGIGPSKNPDDLVRALRCEEEQYGDDDDLVNYSLQYRDEHMTPGIQSPRTEELYENACETIDEAVVNSTGPNSQVGRFLRSQMGGPSVPLASNGPATHSEGGLSGLSSCIDSTGSNNRQESNNNHSGIVTGHTRENSASLLPIDPSSLQAYKNGKQRFSAEHDVMDTPGDMRYDDPSDFDDEKPTDFSARYAEEQLYEPIQHQSMGMMPYTGAGFAGEDQHVHQTDSAQPVPAQNIASNQSEVDDEHRREEEDKFDSGAITPAHYHHTKSGRNSGIMTPRTPAFQETPMMFSRSSSLESLSDCGSIHSYMTSEPGSRMISGTVTPSMLPDSPSQSMPQSPRRSPRTRSLTNLNQLEQNLPKFANAPPPKPKPLPTSDVAEKSYTTNDAVPQNNATPGVAPLPSASAVVEQRLKKLEEPGYTSSLPHKDETSAFKSEGAMSVVTTFSALTIDSTDKIAPVLDDRAMSVMGATVSAKVDGEKENLDAKDVAELPGHSEGDGGKEVLQAGQRAVVNAGYITSLPTSDEIMTFMHEGTLSPMSAFSEMSCLQEHNDGFEKRSASTYSIPNSSSSNKIGAPRSIASNKTSFASRSSATGASFPPPPETRPSGATAAPSKDGPSEKPTSPKDESNASNLTSPTGLSAGRGDDDLSDSDDSLPSSSSDDEDLLKRCIDHAIPKKKSSRNWSSKSSTRSGGSRTSSRGGKSRSKDKPPSDAATKPAELPKPPENPPRSEEEPPKPEENRRTTNPSPEVVKERVKLINIKEKIAAADSKLKLKGLTIREYMDNLAKLDDSIEGEDGLRGEASGNHAAGVQRSREVIGNVETLQQSYSVKKKLRENEKQAKNMADAKNAESAQTSIPRTTGFLPSDSSLSAQSNLRIQSYIREGMANYATEGTPIEMSRSTSLSNLTIDSDGLEINDLTTLQSRLKTSHSVPDIKSEAVNMTSQDRDVYNGGAKERNAASAATTDSREILEDLGKQIESLTLNVAESVVTSKDPGYMTSLPHSDEIRKYAAEGSQSGATEFSALTIDSDTRIAPLQTVPMEGIAESVAPHTDAMTPSHNAIPQRLGDMPQNATSTRQANNMPQTQNVPRQSMPLMQNATTHQHMPLPPDGHENPLSTDQNVRTPVEKISNNGNGGFPESGMPQAPRSLMPPPVEDTPQVYAFNHYNNDNDTMPVKEERITFKNEDTPICFSSNSSLSSLSSEGDGLLEDCITSALPQERNPASMTGNMVMNPPATLDMLGRYSDGVPDGKVDSPTGQRIPFFTQRHPQPLQTRSQTFISSPTLLQSPSEEQWRMFQQESEAISAQLLEQATHGPIRYGAGRPGDMPSSYSYPENMDGLYYTRQSARDSDFSLESSTRGRTLAMPQPRKPRSRQQYDRRAAGSKPSQGYRKDARPGKKSGPGRQRDHPGRQGGKYAHDGNSSSESSPSYHHNQRRRHISTGNSKHIDRRNECGCQAACSRASSQPRCFHHKVASASTSRLEEAMSPTRSRRRSTNSGSKNSFVACEQHSHHHQPKQSRSRMAAKNVYRPSVIQLYPPLKDMDGLLKGVASVAARGDKVVAERGPIRYQSSSNAGISVKSSTSSLSTGLVRQGTFITDSPSPVLLQNMPKGEEKAASKSTGSLSSSPPHSFRSSRSAGNARATTRGSVHSVKSCSVMSTSATKEKATAQSQKKPKHKKVWNGIKKLLSPSDDAKATTKDSLSQKSSNSVKKTARDAKGSKSPKNTKKSAMPNGKTSQQNQPNRLAMSLPEPVKHSTSSLSLSSSSAGENSDSEQEDAARVPQDATAPYGHLPKSPSTGAVPHAHSPNLVTKSQSTGGSVWRRTPPFLPGDATRRDTQPSPMSSRGSATGKSVLPRSRTFVSSEQEVAADVHDSSGYDPDDIWVSQEQLNQRNGVRGVAATASQPPVLRSQSQVSSNEYAAPEGPNLSAKNGPIDLTTPGFPPPPRTQSPRVVQQVAPFNYKPRIPPETPANVWVEKKPRGPVDSGCKQTSV